MDPGRLARRAGPLAIAAALHALLPALPAAASEWRLATERDGVRIFSRKVPGTAVHELRGEATIGLPAARIFALICDLDAYPGVMPRTTESRLLRRDVDAAWYYMVIDPPWIARRDFCVRAERSHLPDGSLVASWTLDGEGCPAPRPGYVRLPRNEGKWVLTPLGDASTALSYQALTDPGGTIPKWLVNKGAPGGIVDVIEAVRRAAALPKYAR